MSAGTPAAVAPAHSNWLYHHLTMTGMDPVLEAFVAAAAGAGVIPWYHDLDRVEEDALLQ